MLVHVAFEIEIYKDSKEGNFKDCSYCLGAVNKILEFLTSCEFASLLHHLFPISKGFFNNRKVFRYKSPNLLKLEEIVLNNKLIKKVITKKRCLNIITNIKDYLRLVA